ncbi:MAG TPA: MBL fold metallo-hydrolase [Rhizomicrobium sp.]|nr:MBL fold metallo-hydrolase [Rhizomicrobium sp.]
MLQWKIGDVTVKRIVEMEVPVKYNPKYSLLPDATPEALRKMPWLYPHFVAEDGTLALSIHALLVEAPGLRLVVDTCVGNDKPRGLTGNLPLATPFLQHMAEAGWTRESVDAVVCTHLHVDHVGWNTMKDGDKWVPTFPNARYLIGKAEYEHWKKEGDDDQQAILSDSVKPVFDAGLAQLVELNHRVSPEIRLIPTTGHTPGHVSVVIESKGESAVITGDMVHHPCQFTQPDWSDRFDTDGKAAAVTRHAFVKDFADRPVLVIGTHFAAPTAGRIRKEDGVYKFIA